MVLKADYQSILQVFVYSNLPTLMNPDNASHVVVTNAIIPTTPMTPTASTAPNTAMNTTAGTSTTSTSTTAVSTSLSNTSTTTTSTASNSNASTTAINNTTPVLMITPTILQAIQSYVLNNFPDIGLPQDIQQIAKNFLANLPPTVPINNTTSRTSTSAASTS